MNALLLERPRMEPVSLGDMRDWLRVETPDEDDIIASLIVAARERVEAQTGIKLMHQSWRLRMEWRDGIRRFRSALRPIIAIEAMRLIRADDGIIPVASEDVLLRRDDRESLLVLRDHVEVPADVAGVEWDVTCGMAALPAQVPHPLQQAIRLLAAQWYAHRGDGAASQEVPAAVTALLAPHRRVRLS